MCPSWHQILATPLTAHLRYWFYLYMTQASQLSWNFKVILKYLEMSKFVLKMQTFHQKFKKFHFLTVCKCLDLWLYVVWPHKPLLCIEFQILRFRIEQSSQASLKVLESTWLFSPKFKALKVLEKRTGAWKSLNFITQVLESPWIHHDVNHCDHQIH